ncbi:uncharacterized protein LOC129778046 [Toxorhynchites rutilus septentrionalis]|uniref:uncharacterized protein LOC129778046 n=1 Tax=Toxorhynchites rutilus septentrionalis TaxID=329112 RepID=UPI00247B2D82|nr:uncharacterized protein LOC129778046 [Toxorhynchites rutilus septentrionalis]
MALTAGSSSEKPSPQPPTMEPTPSGSYFKSKHGKAKVAEITFGLIASILLISFRWLTITEYGFLFVAFNATLLTTIVLWDNVHGEKLRNLLAVSTRVDQRYNAIVALLFYIFSFYVLAVSGKMYDTGFKIATGVTGMLASFAYAYNWGLLRRERLLEGTIAANVDEFDQEEQKQRDRLV